MFRPVIVVCLVLATAVAYKTLVEPDDQPPSYFDILRQPKSSRKAGAAKSLQVVSLNVNAVASTVDSYPPGGPESTSTPPPVLLVATLDGKFHCIDYAHGRLKVR